MDRFEKQRLYNPQCTNENRLPPRATIVPALHQGVFYKNRLESELIIDLNGDYKFCYCENDSLKDFFTLNFCDKAWKNLVVPSMWQYHGYSAPVYPNVEYPIPFIPPYVGNKNPVGYYRKRFFAHKGGRKILYFGGVDNAFFVYLNGEYVGFSKGSRIPAEFDVTDLVCEGENLLCIKVFTYSDGTYLENQDMLLASGIFRDVMLFALDEIYVWDYSIRTIKDNVLIEVALEGSEFANSNLKVKVAGLEKNAKATKKAVFQFKIDNPIQWNAEQPYTYEVVIELYNGNGLLEVHTKKVGFAEYSIEGNRLLLNGTQITLKGINRHEHDPKNGRAITVAQIERELKLIKDHNINAIRCSHYPNNPAFYEICTELGFYVMDEADLETHGAAVCGDMGYFSKHPDWYQAYIDRVSRMYERDKNETCISIWTTGNEHGDGENLLKCIEYLKSRPIKKPIMHTGQIGIEPKEITDFRGVGYFTMKTLMDFPPEGKPLMMLEYGHAMGNSPGLMKDTWDYVYHNRHICGGYVWEFKNHGFYCQDKDGNVFYKYGGDFEDINHWSNFSMDGYCLSDGTPKPSLRECKNVLAPTYVSYENGRIYLMNTNDFRALDYITLRWELAEDYLVLKQGEMRLPAVAPYEKVLLDLDTHILHPKAGAEYFMNLRFYGEQNEEIAYKQVSLGIQKEKECFVNLSADMQVKTSNDEIVIMDDNTKICFSNGLISYYEREGKIIFHESMKLNLYRAPIDNDGITNWSERWIAEWGQHLYQYFEFFLLSWDIEKGENGTIILTVKGKWAPISTFNGFDVEIVYTIMGKGDIFVAIHGKPYGQFAATIPRIGVAFTLDNSMNNVLWYGRGEDECYVDRCEHCNVGLYKKLISEMNFLYDVPQECGTRINTRFLRVGDEKNAISIIGSNDFSFSYHNFMLTDLIAARHRNELKESAKNQLYIDYAMRGIGSNSCGPDPEEQYELRAHEFTFAFMITSYRGENELLELSRKRFDVVTERMGVNHQETLKKSYINFVECNVD